jgi:hypothetical protein
VITLRLQGNALYPLQCGTSQWISNERRACGKLRVNEYSASGRTKKVGILVSGLMNHEMVAGVRFELTTFGLCDLTQLSLRVGLYLHPV